MTLPLTRRVHQRWLDGFTRVDIVQVTPQMPLIARTKRVFVCILPVRYKMKIRG